MDARDQFTKTSTLTNWLLCYYFTCRANQRNGQITSPTERRRPHASSRHILWKMSATLSVASDQTVNFTRYSSRCACYPRPCLRMPALFLSRSYHHVDEGKKLRIVRSHASDVQRLLDCDMKMNVVSVEPITCPVWVKDSETYVP